MIPYSQHSLDEADRDAVLRVLDSDRLTQGPEVDAFEQEFAKAVGAPYAVSFSSGTSALHAATYIAKKEGARSLITSALTFVASANCGAYTGLRPLFADIDPETWNLDPDSVVQTGHSNLGEMPAVVVPVHFAGLPADVKSISERTGALIIEDACHALGARTADGPVGNCAHSDFTCFSFHPAKAITTAEGGMVTCRTKDHVKALKRFRNHGFELTSGWYREMVELGHNYRLSDLHAALGRSQLPKLPQFIERRREIAERYLEELEGVAELPPSDPHHAWHLFVIRHPARNAIYEALRERHIQTQVHYLPLYLNPFYHDPYRPEYPNTEAYYAECLSLPIFPALSDSEQTTVIEAVRDVV